MNFDERLLEGMRVDPSYDEDILHQVLRIAVYDEYHAYNTYKKVIDTFGDMKPFSNIMQAEVNHYSALVVLLEKYEVPIPEDNWEEKIQIPATILECCELGVAAEIDNVAMYDNLLQYSQEYPDITDLLYRLQAASYNNHLPAFRKCVQNYSTKAVGNEDATMNELGAMAQKIAAGEMSQEDIMAYLSTTNMSFLGGLLLGGVGAAMTTSMLNKNEGE